MLTSEEMREAEARAIAGGGVTGSELMERAGEGVVTAMMDRWPGWDGLDPAPCKGQVVLVLCGPGNNGGDGYVIARRLRDAGAMCHVLAFGDTDRLPPDAARAHALWQGDVAQFDREQMIRAADRAARAGQDWLVVVDALFGIGQRAPLDAVTEKVGAFLDHIIGEGTLRPWFVAVDLPTGYDADSGAALARRPLPANLTVTFHQPKPIHGLPHFLDGELVVHDIGI